MNTPIQHNPHQHLSEDDLALFALALMPPEDAAFALAHLKHCQQCRDEVARMQGDLVGYAMTAEMHAPRPEARTRFLDAVAQEKRLVPISEPEPAAEPVIAPRSTNLLDRDGRAADKAGARHLGEEPRRGLGWFGWLGWAAAAAAAGVAGFEFHQGQQLQDQLHTETARAEQASADAAKSERVMQALTDPAAMQVALHLATLPGAPKPEAHASYNAARRELVFVATHLDPLKPEKTYQLWILPANGGNPVSAGLFKPDARGNASLVLPELTEAVAAKGFGVTVENEGGSSKPTPPIVLAGG